MKPITVYGIYDQATQDLVLLPRKDNVLHSTTPDLEWIRQVFKNSKELVVVTIQALADVEAPAALPSPAADGTSAP